MVANTVQDRCRRSKRRQPAARGMQHAALTRLEGAAWRRD
jgi:hypothetical protein